MEIWNMKELPQVGDKVKVVRCGDECSHFTDWNKNKDLLGRAFTVSHAILGFNPIWTLLPVIAPSSDVFHDEDEFRNSESIMFANQEHMEILERNTQPFKETTP